MRLFNWTTGVSTALSRQAGLVVNILPLPIGPLDLAEVLPEIEPDFVYEPALEVWVHQIGPDDGPALEAHTDDEPTRVGLRGHHRCHVDVSNCISRIERSAGAEEPSGMQADGPAVASRDHVESIDKEVRVHARTNRYPGAATDEQRAGGGTIAWKAGSYDPNLTRRSTRHLPVVTS